MSESFKMNSIGMILGFNADNAESCSYLWCYLLIINFLAHINNNNNNNINQISAMSY